MQGKEILRLVDSLHRDKDIDEEVIFQAIESALESAARKHFGLDEDITVQIDRDTGDVVALKDGERIEPEALGRIAAQTAKQIIIQKIREAESETIYNEYVDRVGSLVMGTVQRFEGGAIIVNLERTEAILPRSEQIPGEHYQAGERVRAVILDVRRFNSLVKILLSRTSLELIRRLFELEVPEVAEGVVQIKKIAREPGLRTKIAVESLDSRVDCIGACVGVRGTRIKSIIDEVKGEKIDIIPWSEAPETLISSSLRPAEILQITLEEGEETKRAIVVVPEDQLSLAIGWKGQNVRLAVKMSGWDIDIEPPEELPEEEEQAEEEEPAEVEEQPEEEEQAQVEEPAGVEEQPEEEEQAEVEAAQVEERPEEEEQAEEEEPAEVEAAQAPALEGEPSEPAEADEPPAPTGEETELIEATEDTQVEEQAGMAEDEAGTSGQVDPAETLETLTESSENTDAPEG